MLHLNQNEHSSALTRHFAPNSTPQLCVTEQDESDGMWSAWTQMLFQYLHANHLLRDVDHGTSQPVLQVFGKVTDGVG